MKLFLSTCDQWSLYCITDAKGWIIACVKLWKIFIRSLRRSSVNYISFLLHNAFLLSFPSPDHPIFCTMLYCNRIELQASMNLCDFSFIIAWSISYCEVTWIKNPHFLCSTFFIAADLRLPKVWEQCLFCFFIFSEATLWCCWVVSRYLFFCETADYLWFRCISLLLIAFCLTFYKATQLKSAILSSLDRVKKSEKLFLSCSLCFKISFQKWQVLPAVSITG